MVKTAEEKTSTPVIMLRSPHYTGYTEAANYYILLKYLTYSISYDLGHAFDERTTILYDDRELDDNNEQFVEIMCKIARIYKNLTEDNELLSASLFGFLFFSNPLGKECQLKPSDCHTLLLVMSDFPAEAEVYDFGVIPLKYFDPEMSLSAEKIRTILQDCVVMEEPLLLSAGEVPSNAYKTEAGPESMYYS